MIEEIVPETVCAADVQVASHTQSGLGDSLHLFPEEEKRMARALARRRREFAEVRMCAHRALAALGRTPVPLLPDERGATLWPAGITGSMTHCAGYRAAALARRADVASLGIDAERDGPLGEGTAEVVALPVELRHLRELSRARPVVHWDRLLFSAKESVYKAWSPFAGGRSLGFHDAHIEFHPGPGPGPGPGDADSELGPGKGTFTARLRAPRGPVPGTLRGAWLARDGLLLTAVTVPADALSPRGTPPRGAGPTPGRCAPGGR
ncbi:4'-phosphopantetheinyl transferase superfamily protein [Streptomyces sp. NPDC007369]|uniref:4'-phosphopantetheinyl transferase family protein n=1 Tax=Streptomyces sp. NPDC007369 TaxID=3154589 RepID=UPI00340BDD4D